MAGSVNKVILVGNLGADPEIRTFQNGGKVANISIATSESWKDKESGERKEKTQWHRVVINNEGLVGVCERYLKKGAKVYIEGQLETRKYTDKAGNDAYATEVVLRPFNGQLTMLSSNGKGDAEGSEESYHKGYSTSGGDAQDNSSYTSPTAATGVDDEIPF